MTPQSSTMTDRAFRELHELYLSARNPKYRRLFVKHRGVCALCGKSIDMLANESSPAFGTIGHIIPKMYLKKGQHTANNLQLECAKCNTAKGNSAISVDETIRLWCDRFLV